MDDNNRPKFTCSQCGNHELVVSHTWIIQAGTSGETWREWGPLKNDHHWRYEFKEKVQSDEDDEVELGDFSDFEADDSSSEPEEYEINETRTDREGDEFFLNCGNCDRQVEFGWSLPDRRGIILPVEFSDFDPAKAWPDPKYADLWQQRGWLQKRNLPA